VKQSHNKFNLYTIPNNSLHLNPAISQIPLPHLPKTQQSLPIKSTHHSIILIKIIIQNTPLSKSTISYHHKMLIEIVSNFRTILITQNSLKNTSQKILKCQIDTSRYNHFNFILISCHLQL